MTKIYLDKLIKDRLWDMYKSNGNELGGSVLGEKFKNDIYLIEFSVDFGSENSVSAHESFNYDHICKAHNYPSKYEFFSCHSHGCKEGSRILNYDPYWTISGKKHDISSGMIVNNKFFTTMRESDHDGDTGCLYLTQDYINNNYGSNIIVDKEIFIHPKYGSEGKIMNKDLFEVTCVKIDPRMVFGVRNYKVNSNIKYL